MIKYNVILCSILFYSILLYEALAAPAVRIMGVREHGHPPLSATLGPVGNCY